MRALPSEQIEGAKRHQHRVKKETNPKLARYKIEIKKITGRLEDFADRDLPDDGILDLLQDTRAKVLSLHIARKELQKNRNNKRKNRPAR